MTSTNLITLEESLCTLACGVFGTERSILGWIFIRLGSVDSKSCGGVNIDNVKYVPGAAWNVHKSNFLPVSPIGRFSALLTFSLHQHFALLGLGSWMEIDWSPFLSSLSK